MHRYIKHFFQQNRLIRSNVSRTYGSVALRLCFDVIRRLMPDIRKRIGASSCWARSQLFDFVFIDLFSFKGFKGTHLLKFNEIEV